jgi:4-aminobutyrate aminotransferase-like enzyme
MLLHKIIRAFVAFFKKGVVTDWFLFAPNCLRIAPPLIITEEEIKHCCQVILENCFEVADSQ